MLHIDCSEDSAHYAVECPVAEFVRGFPLETILRWIACYGFSTRIASASVTRNVISILAVICLVLAMITTGIAPLGATATRPRAPASREATSAILLCLL